MGYIFGERLSWKEAFPVIFGISAIPVINGRKSGIAICFNQEDIRIAVIVYVIERYGIQAGKCFAGQMLRDILGEFGEDFPIPHQLDMEIGIAL